MVELDQRFACVRRRSETILGGVREGAARAGAGALIADVRTNSSGFRFLIYSGAKVRGSIVLEGSWRMASLEAELGAR